MTEATRRATLDVLDCLVTLGREAVRPHEAQRRLRAVQAQHPDVAMELVWEEEAYDGSLHYDALLRDGDGVTTSLSSCREGALPWPLRGVHRWSDADLAQVNGNILKMQDAVAFLDLLWKEAPILERIVNACLLREELERHPVEIGDVALQRGMDDFRRLHGLHDAAGTHRWMEERGLTHDRLEQLITENLTFDALREGIARDRVDGYFEEHRAALDTAQVARVAFPDEESARRVHRLVGAGELDFFDAAQQQFLTVPASRTFLFATLRRRDVSDEEGATVFGAAPGEVVGPTRVDDGHVLTRVLSVTPARLDVPTRTAIKEILMDEWLAERRRAARVTWFWGTSDRA